MLCTWNYHNIVNQLFSNMGFPHGSAVKNPPATQETRFDPWVRKIPLEEEMATHSSILAWRSHKLRSLEDYSPQDHKESDITEATEHALQYKIKSKKKMISRLTEIESICMLI